MNNQEKGDLLESLVKHFCEGIKNAKVEHNAKIVGKSKVCRQIDTLITGEFSCFEVKILIDAKNYSSPLDIKDIESIEGMVEDTGANLGVVICPAGFTNGAKKRAVMGGIEIYEIYDKSLGNTNLFIPVRYIEPKISKYSFKFEYSSNAGYFSIQPDSSRWVFNLEDKVLKAEEVPIYMWNEKKFPQHAGEFEICVGAVKMTDSIDLNFVQYCDLKLKIIVTEDYYLKLFPASFIKRIDTGDNKEHFNLRMDFYSNKDDKTINGWKQFKSMDDMNKAADIEVQPKSVRDIIIRVEYNYP